MTLATPAELRQTRTPTPRAAAVGRLVRRHGTPVGLALVLGYLILFPLVRLQILALSDGGRAYQDAWSLDGLGKTLGTTAALGLGSLVISLTLGTTLAWFALRLPSRWRWLGSVPVLPIVLPAVAVVVGWAFLFSPQVGFVNVWLRKLPFLDSLPFLDVETPKVGLPSGPFDVYSVPAIIVITGLQLTPLVFLFVKSGLSQINFEAIEAAMASGAHELRAFFGIVLPMLRPSLIYAGAFGMLLGLGQLTAPQFLGSREGIRVLATEVYRFGGESPADYALAAAVASPLLVAGVVFIAVQRFLLRQDFRFSTTGTKGANRPLTTSRLAAPIIGTFGLLTLVLPLLALFLVAFSRFWSGDLKLDTMTLDNFRAVFSEPRITSALQNSIVISVVAMLVALPLAYLLADILYRRRGAGWTRAVIDFLVQMPLGVPAVVFGIGLLYVYLGHPFTLYGTRFLIVITYVIIVLPFSLRMLLAARISVGTAYEDAARASGASLLQTHLTIMVPMMRGAIAGSCVLMFVILTHEFAASMFVRSTQTQVLGTLLHTEWTHGSYPMVAAVSIVMSAVTAAGLLLALAIGGRGNTLDRF
ncbi:ABC transporter permease subunit [Nocardioides carbamazepini]|uniref:ABC transporter permease n=1 Tax=Nocardioides carbamazepini TaxID=2854259 RepID=UPI00214A08FE|nr:ABC transporter permease subunit [Nocardioides carbamazepini]MCR1785053.1 ABC transporter permease subunit [Nocardioides carbamazepini]